MIQKILETIFVLLGIIVACGLVTLVSKLALDFGDFLYDKIDKATGRRKKDEEV